MLGGLGSRQPCNKPANAASRATGPLTYRAVVSVSPRPVLRDGEVVLRPGTFDDDEAGRLRHEQEVPPGVVSFVIEHRARVAGTVEVRPTGDGNGELTWAVSPDHRGQGVGTRAVRLLVRYAFDELGLHRVVAYVEREDRVSLRIAARAGLRREGIVRAGRQGRGAHHGEHGGYGEHGGHGEHGERRDYVQLARLATDPEPTAGVGFIGILNAGLPTKRVIAQGLILNSANEILLCELTYKQEWDLPGGVVDPYESPAHAVVREIREEMQVEVSPRSLVAVNWLPPWRGWDDAMLFVFDLGVDDDVIARARLEPRELRALHWCTLDQVERRTAPYVTRMLRRLAQRTDGTAYLEDGVDQGW
jgi:RimJ/RimL family protein N-acetyltransferase/ADP-ribose pyrophosphatase YjhB (NUDIX family)